MRGHNIFAGPALRRGVQATRADATQARQHLADGGMILFDNSGRKRYLAGIDASGLSANHTRGLTAALPYPDQTTLMTHRSVESAS